MDPGSGCRFLAERFEYDGSAKGSTVSCELGAEGTLSVSPFLDAEHHLSYPFVVHHEDRAYLIPETSEIGTVLIYSINPGGTLGRPVALLEGTQVVDATVVLCNQRWWLFCSEGSLKLLAFHAEALEGPWSPHRLNPLKIDVTSSRRRGLYSSATGCFCGRPRTARAPMERPLSFIGSSSSRPIASRKSAWDGSDLRSTDRIRTASTP